MDDYFIEKINWNSCTNPINAIDFIASIKELEKLVTILELLGFTFYEEYKLTYLKSQDEYLTLIIDGTCVEIGVCGEHIAPVPTEYISTIVPALVLAHLNDPASVKQVYNEFFINKKEEITPLLDE